jgi:hypothetical protein
VPGDETVEPLLGVETVTPAKVEVAKVAKTRIGAQLFITRSPAFLNYVTRRIAGFYVRF